MDLITGHPLRALADAWLGRIRKARDAKAPWQEIADICMAFYSGSTGFLWENAKLRNKIMGGGEGGEVNPKFRITLCKAFELVALFAPMLYWKNPVRTASPRPPLEIMPDVELELMGIDPAEFQQIQQQLAQLQQQGQPLPPQMAMLAAQVQGVQQQIEQLQKDQQRDQRARQVTAELMSRYLNFTPFELELHEHAKMAITEAMVKGRGVLFQELYRPPGSQRTMVGSFWHTVDKLFIDPDAEGLDDAWWIALECCEPIWQTERRCGLPRGSMKGLAQYESLAAQAENNAGAADDAQDRRERGEAEDLLVYYKVWTRCGIGSRLTEEAGFNPKLKQKFDDTCGDYCYFEVASGVPWLLNLPTRRFLDATTDEVREAMQWPVPHYKDGKWPCSVLDFYPKPRSAWPIAPLAPGLGELIAINIIMSHYVSRVWMSSRDFIGVLQSAADELEEKISKGEDLTIIRLTEGIEDINKAVQFLQHPETRLDVQRVLTWLFELFDKRTGLTELAYGLNPQGAQERTATSTRIKQQNISIRPDDMAAKVEHWQTHVALREALAVRWWIEADDVVDQLGPAGARLWKHFITNRDVERTIYDIDYRLETSSARKPNRDRDMANINEAMPMMMPAAMGYAQLTRGNFTPVKWLFDKWGATAEMDTSGLQFPPPQPSGAEQQEVQQAQQEMQLEQQRARQEMQIGQAEHQAEQARKQQAHQLEIRQDQQEHVQEIRQDQQQHEQDMEFAEQKAKLEASLARLKAKAQAAAATAKAKAQPKRAAA